MNPTLYIGIDPGVNTGVAIWHKETKTLVLRQFASHGEAMLYLSAMLRDEPKASVKFRIEDARLTTKYARKLPKHLIPQVNRKKEQGVGYVKAYSKDWAMFCETQGYACELLPPGQTKTTPEYFEKLTGIKTLKTQHHQRDAGMLVYGY